MSDNEKLIEDVAEQIGLGIHTSLRKSIDEPGAMKAWHAINDLEDGNWYVVCRIVSEVVVKMIMEKK